VTVTVPIVAPATIEYVSVALSPSFATSVPGVVVSSATVSVPFAATGASLTGVIVTVVSWLAQAPGGGAAPSQTWIETTQDAAGAGPTGVNEYSPVVGLIEPPQVLLPVRVQFVAGPSGSAEVALYV
jgi:hypothetical protein